MRNGDDTQGRVYFKQFGAERLKQDLNFTGGSKRPYESI